MSFVSVYKYSLIPFDANSSEITKTLQCDKVTSFPKKLLKRDIPLLIEVHYIEFTTEEED